MFVTEKEQEQVQGEKKKSFKEKTNPFINKTAFNKYFMALRDVHKELFRLLIELKLREKRERKNIEAIFPHNHDATFYLNLSPYFL